MIGSDFIPMVLTRYRRCSECGTPMQKGQTYLASVKNGKVKKWICSEECRQTFDDRFWQEVARQRREK